jgi:hypothetical protein
MPWRRFGCIAWLLSGNHGVAPPGTPVPQLGHVYYATMGAGLAIALIVIGVTPPLLKRMTGPDSARFE